MVVVNYNEGCVPRVARAEEQDRFARATYDPSLRIGNPGRLERDWTQRKINAELAEQEGWVPSDDIDPALLLASQGGFDRVLMNHVQCVNAQDSLEQRAGVVRSALASYTRPSEFTWLVASNGVLAIKGKFDAPMGEAMRVRVTYHGALNAKTVDEDLPAPELLVDEFVVRKSVRGGNEIRFSQEVKLLGMTREASPVSRTIAQDAALSFLRPSGNRSRLLCVSMQPLDGSDAPIGDTVASRVFDVEYRWRNKALEDARYTGDATELCGDTYERVAAVVERIKARQMVAAVVSHATRTVPHREATLVSRLRYYDAQLVEYPALLDDKGFIHVLGAVSDALMPKLETQLKAAPELKDDLDFVTNYNLCAQYTTGETLTDVVV